MSGAPIRVLLLDADGVIQWMPRFLARVDALLGGRDLLGVLFEMESRFMTGAGDLRSGLEGVLAEHGLGHAIDELLQAWVDIEPDAEVLALVDAVRAGGVPVYLATNQQAFRGPYMLRSADYVDRFDGQFHSFQLGVAKPDPAFFTAILDRLGVEASGVLFVDDIAANVAGARTVGIVAEHHERTDGAAGVGAILRRHGLLAGLAHPVAGAAGGRAPGQTYGRSGGTSPAQAP